MKVLHVTAPGK